MKSSLLPLQLLLNLLLGGAIFLAIPFTVSAQNTIESLGESFDIVKQQAGQLGVNTETEPKKLITKVIETFLQIVGVVALALVIWGGFVYLTSAGDENRAALGKRIVLGTIIGLIIIGLSAVIVNFTIGLFSGGSGGTGPDPVDPPSSAN